MASNPTAPAPAARNPLLVPCAVLTAVGLAAFLAGLLGNHPERAWQAYLVNFLLWSAVAQGAVLFSAVTHMTRARWSGPLDGLSAAFAGFFPLSFAFFLILFLGSDHLFPWRHEDLHGKELWLNLPFLFTRDALGLLVLYGLGFAFLAQGLRLKADRSRPSSGLRRLFLGAQPPAEPALARIRSRATLWAGLYIFAFAMVLSLIGYDLVMSMDPHWVSTLFGAYHFVKAFYVGLGALIILACIVRLRQGPGSALTPGHFHDIGKLFFAFCLLWADFFYVQLTVIWYGNIPEETHYVLLRTVLPPWRSLAWTVFILAFIIPFAVLLNRRVKTRPRFMLVLASTVIVAIWLEHLLLIGPALDPQAAGLPLGVGEALIFVGFLALMVGAVAHSLNLFPELMPPAKEAGR
jgi:hypothetical protein